MVINDPEAGDKELITDGYLIRRTAVDFGVSLITNVKVAALLALSLERVKTFHIKSMDVSGMIVMGDEYHEFLLLYCYFFPFCFLQEYYQTTSVLDTSG